MADDPGSSPVLSAPSRRPKVLSRNGPPPPQDPAPPVFTRRLRKAAVGTGCDIRLRVSVTGWPAPALSWYRGDLLLPPSEAQDAGGLWIRDCRTSDAGLYTCVASNALGEASCSAVLAVMDLGEAPTHCHAQSHSPPLGPHRPFKTPHTPHPSTTATVRHASRLCADVTQGCSVAHALGQSTKSI
ncbi:hypothetical protein NL108_002590 [Boleophthalmus pectinirostris]|nr:hypothetical protein NL108_002590 [Boleophthalmus pectinirostris]